VGRKGKKRALIAVGHKILCAVYHILKNKVKYQDLGTEWFEKERKQKRIKYLKSELRELGIAI
jgi:transposase